MPPLPPSSFMACRGTALLFLLRWDIASFELFIEVSNAQLKVHMRRQTTPNIILVNFPRNLLKLCQISYNFK
jgi:hypothetical protein